MEDIELIIKMPKEMYKWANDINKFFDDYGTSDFIDLVKNGTPLPKGHGRLIDADALDKSLEKEQEDLDLDDELSNAFGDGLTWASEVLSKEPTIIEADNKNKQ